MAETARYRVGQFLRALTARVSEKEIEQAMRILRPKAQMLFHRQAIQDQRHALAVYHKLCHAGHTNPQLLAAALLHDVGKAAARLPAWQRAVIVLLDRFAPRLLARLSRGEPQGRPMSDLTTRLSGSAKPTGEAPPKPDLAEVLPKGWRRAFVVHAWHPEVGARWAQEAGCSALTVALIRRHQDRISDCQTKEDELLAMLQAADNVD